MICSMIRREHEDAEFGLRTLAEVVDLDGAEGLSYEEVITEYLYYNSIIISFYMSVQPPTSKLNEKQEVAIA